MFHFQANRKSLGFSKKAVLGIFKIALHLRDRHVLKHGLFKTWFDFVICTIFDNILDYLADPNT